MKRITSVTFILILSVYLILTISSALTLLPNCDEAWFTNPGYNLVKNGFFGTTVLDETATFRQVKLDGINRSTYWIMPAYPLVQAAVGKVLRFGLIETRSVSIFFGIVTLLAWAYLVKKLSNHSFIALLAIGLMAVDYHFVYAASEGRMDMMAAALGVSGLAVFAWLRDKSLSHAILFSFILEAFSFFTHPLGLMWAVSLAILIALLDLRQIKMKHFALAALPFVFLGLFWLSYIMQNPDLFSRQFGGNASDRWGFFAAPFSEFWKEMKLRYIYNFGIGEGLTGAGQIKIIILLSYMLSIIGVLSVKTLRKQSFPCFLLILAAQEFVMLLLLDGMKQSYYLIHIVPTLAVILAVWINWLWSKKPILKAVSLGFLIIVVFVNVGVNLLRIRRNAYQENYLAAANVLNQNADSSDMVMASAEFWFALNRKENLLDDYRLGYETGRKADFIVMDAPRYQDWFENLAKEEPQTYQYIESLLLNDYQIIYEDGIYHVYKRKEK